MKMIQKKIKKELSEELMPTFDYSKSSLSTGEIDQVVTNLSLNMIKTREILKETFDEYILTLISFDKIKNKIKFLKTKNDESFNDCSPVFSNKFKLISNIEKQFNEKLERIDVSNNFSNEDSESFSNKQNQISLYTGKISKINNKSTNQENHKPIERKRNSIEGKEKKVVPSLNFCSNHISEKEENETLRENSNENLKFLKNSSGIKNKDHNCWKGFDSKNDSDEDYEIYENHKEFESFANKTRNLNESFYLRGAENSADCSFKKNSNKGLETKGDKRYLNRDYSDMANNKNEGDNLYGSNDPDCEEVNHIDYNFQQRESYLRNDIKLDGEREDYDHNLDIHSLYLDSMQEEEFQVGKFKYLNPHNDYLKISNDVSNNNPKMKDNLNISEEEFKRNFPMRFYRHFQTENNNKISESTYMKGDSNDTYRQTRNHGNSSHLTHNSTSQNVCRNKIKIPKNKFKFNESHASYDFKNNNLSAIPNDLVYPDLYSHKNGVKNISCNSTSEKRRHQSKEENELSSDLECKNNKENTILREGLEIHNCNRNGKILTRNDRMLNINNKSNFLSPYKKKEAKAPILNTGNKIHKMSYFDLQTNQTFVTNQTNENIHYEKEDNQNDEINFDTKRKANLHNSSMDSLDTKSVYNRHKNKNPLAKDMKHRYNNRKDHLKTDYNRLDQLTQKTVDSERSNFVRENNKNGLLNYKKTLPLDISNNLNIADFTNSRILPNESSVYKLTNKSNTQLDSSIAINPENSHIDLIQSSCNKVNKSYLKNKNVKENSNNNNHGVKISHQIDKRLIESSDSYIFNTLDGERIINFNNPDSSIQSYKVQESNSLFLENNAKNNYCKHSLSGGLNKSPKEGGILMQDSRDMNYTHFTRNNGKIEKSDIQAINKINQISMERTHSNKNKENVSPNYGN